MIRTRDQAPHLLRDLRLRLGHRELRPVYSVATERRPVPGRRGAGHRRLEDFATVDGRSNLGQAVILRLLTPRGELAALGHPDYGSRLHTLIGRQNSATIRNLARLYILESLEREPRIARILQLSVEPDESRRDLVRVALEVEPAQDAAPVPLGPFLLSLETT